MENLVVNIKRTDDKVHFEAVTNTNPNMEIPFDFSKPLGTGCGYSGLEMLLASFAGCVSTTIVFLLNRLQKHINSYQAKIEGVRSEHPLALKEIIFHIDINSTDLTEVDMENVIKQAEMISPVWQALKNNVLVQITFKITKL